MLPIAPRAYATYPRHVSPPPWAPPDPQTRHVPHRHVPYHVPSHVAILSTAFHAAPHQPPLHPRAFPRLHTHSRSRSHHDLFTPRSGLALLHLSFILSVLQILWTRGSARLVIFCASRMPCGPDRPAPVLLHESPAGQNFLRNAGQNHEPQPPLAGHCASALPRDLSRGLLRTWRAVRRGVHRVNRMFCMTCLAHGGVSFFVLRACHADRTDPRLWTLVCYGHVWVTCAGAGSRSLEENSALQRVSAPQVSSRASLSTTFDSAARAGAGCSRQRTGWTRCS